MRAVSTPWSVEAAPPVMETLTAQDFLAFTDTRPDEEKWELLDGIAVLNPSPSFLHQIILQNLIVLLRSAQKATDSNWMSVPGFGLRITEKNVPVPDLLVRPKTFLHAQDCDDAIVAFEILSPSTAHRDRSWKRTAYANLPSLQQYVIVAQDDASVLSYERHAGFAETKIVGLNAKLVMSVLGVELSLADIYEGTGQ